MTTKEVNFTVHHVARIEGHGNIIVNAKDGKIEECKWEIPESPRFFESMLRGLQLFRRQFHRPAHLRHLRRGPCQRHPSRPPKPPSASS